MSDDFKIRSSLSNRRTPTESITSKNLIKNLDINQPQEIYRNNTTAVEVIVKQVKNKNAKQNKALEENNLDGLCREIEKLKMELYSANRNLEVARKGFSVVMFEMGKQLESANQRELKRQTKNIILQLEKEKIKLILESKTKLVSKMSKELLTMKRTLKMLSKSLKSIASVSNVHTDSEYDEFEDNLLKTQGDVNLTDPLTYTTVSSK